MHAPLLYDQYEEKTRPRAYLPRVKEGGLVQRDPEWSHDDQFKQQTQQQRDDSSHQQGNNQCLKNLRKGQKMSTVSGRAQPQKMCCNCSFLYMVQKTIRTE